jgi:hypothetical protein
VRIRLPLNWHKRNYAGTIYGRSMYAAIDRVYAVMLIKILGPGYEAWDEAAAMRFRHPGRSTLLATFNISADELKAIRAALAQDGRTERQYSIDMTDKSNRICFSCEKILSIRKIYSRSFQAADDC